MNDPIKLAVLAGAGEEIALGASSITIKLSGADTGGAFALMEYVAPPGAGSPAHTHGREEETFYVREGGLLFHLGGEEFVAGPGSVVHIPRGLLHDFQNVGEAPCVAMILATPAGLEGYFRDLGALVQRGDAATQDDLSALNRRYGLDFG